jgi:hypothetical protein
LITGTAAILPVLGQAQAPATPATKGTLSKAEFALLDELAERIIPKTDTPGAAEAGVARIIDSTLAANPQKLKRWRETLAWFAQNGANPASRLALLERISKEQGTDGARHFESLKSETIDVYYSTMEGLKQELGWNANTFLSEFKGCTHPEHKG